MKEKITTILLTLAIAITGINTPAYKANAETKEAKTTAETATEAPSETTVPTAIPASTMKPAATVRPAPTQPAIGTLATANGGITIIYTEDGWKTYSTPAPSTTPEPTKKPEKPFIIIKGSDGCYNLDAKNKKTEITKGFKRDVWYCGDKLKSSNTKVVSVEEKGIDETEPSYLVRKKATLTAKKYGTVTLTTEYGGQKASMKVKVCKNVYKGKNDNEFKTESKSLEARESRLPYRVLCKFKDGPITVKYDKKGNLVVKYTIINHSFTKVGKRAKMECHFFNMQVNIEYKGKKVIDRKLEKKKDEFVPISPKKPIASVTYTVPKKYLKTKKMDLRQCLFNISVNRIN